ncbi:hypothetical protein BDV93DRAFT_525973 [Ceratobasidium sp. AG-I]|nr:hypothetical protein BDV93DRAFT_525973 [Ceratobasidium sp. AG-I]
MAHRTLDVNFDYIESEDDDAEKLPTPASSSTVVKAKAVVTSFRATKKDTSSLFLKPDGTSIRFYVARKSMDEASADELERRILACGGSLADKLPKDGYVLVDQCTKQGAHTIRTYTRPELERRIVSMHFVDESMARGEIVPYSELILFIQEDMPVLFHLHESLEETDRESLRNSILLGGGHPGAPLGHAQVLIHGPIKQKELNAFQREYENIVRFETRAWLNSCVKRNRFQLTPQVEQVARAPSMPGRKPGAIRNPFIPDDDHNLTVWIANRFGYDTKGRLGENAYKELVETKRHRSWSYRHTWISWRERYKKNQAMFDKKIVEYLQKRPPPLKKSRSLSQKPKANTKRKREDDDEDSMPTGNDTDSTESGGESKYKPSRSQGSPNKRARTDSVVYNTRLQVKKSSSLLPGLPAPPSTPPRSISKPESTPAPPLKSSQSQLPEIQDFQENQENTQETVQEIDLDPSLLDPELLGPDARAILEAHRAEMEAYDAEGGNPGGADEDEDIDVGGVSQFIPSPRKIALSLASSGVVESPQKPPLTSTPVKTRLAAKSVETLAQRLSQIAADFNVGIAFVEGYFKQETMEGTDEDEALGNTREYVEQFAEDRRKRKARKARKG